MQIDHINLVVNNINDTVEFYKLLGFEVIAEFNLHKRFVYISNNVITYELFEDNSLTENKVGHIAYKSENIIEDYNNLKGKVEITVNLTFNEKLWDYGVDYFLFKGSNNEIIEYIRKREKNE